MTILLTGAAGFIGFHVAQALLARGETVIGLDNLNSYYLPALKQARLAKLQGVPGFTFHQVDIADAAALRQAVEGKGVTRIIHLAAQAGVRYSLENPAAYVSANLVGHGNMLDLAKSLGVSHMVYASSSSIYGGNTKTPFCETDMTDDPVSFYGATKKSNELLSHSYARLYGLPLTGLRFFTVYGPWGRPDMAYWIFAERLLKGEPIRIFNQGKMGRDFTYISDITDGVLAALDKSRALGGDDLPHRIYNLGNDRPEELMELVSLVEQSFNVPANRQFEDMQKGDVERTWANIDRARRELGYAPSVRLADGLAAFAEWFQESPFRP